MENVKPLDYKYSVRFLTASDSFECKVLNLEKHFQDILKRFTKEYGEPLIITISKLYVPQE